MIIKNMQGGGGVIKWIIGCPEVGREQLQARDPEIPNSSSQLPVCSCSGSIAGILAKWKVLNAHCRTAVPPLGLTAGALGGSHVADGEERKAEGEEE